MTGVTGNVILKKLRYYTKQKYNLEMRIQHYTTEPFSLKS